MALFGFFVVNFLVTEDALRLTVEALRLTELAFLEIFLLRSSYLFGFFLINKNTPAAPAIDPVTAIPVRIVLLLLPLSFDSSSFWPSTFSFLSDDLSLSFELFVSVASTAKIDSAVVELTAELTELPLDLSLAVLPSLFAVVLELFAEVGALPATVTVFFIVTLSGSLLLLEVLVPEEPYIINI